MRTLMQPRDEVLMATLGGDSNGALKAMWILVMRFGGSGENNLTHAFAFEMRVSICH